MKESEKQAANYVQVVPGSMRCLNCGAKVESMAGHWLLDGQRYSCAVNRTTLEAIKDGGHYVPPSMGEDGFFHCTKPSDLDQPSGLDLPMPAVKQPTESLGTMSSTFMDKARKLVDSYDQAIEDEQRSAADEIRQDLANLCLNYAPMFRRQVPGTLTLQIDPLSKADEPKVCPHCELGEPVTAGPVLVVGSPFDGLTCYGPFADDEALEAAACRISNTDWWSVELHAPEELDEQDAKVAPLDPAWDDFGIEPEQTAPQHQFLATKPLEGAELEEAKRIIALAKDAMPEPKPDFTQHFHSWVISGNGKQRFCGDPRCAAYEDLPAIPDVPTKLFTAPSAIPDVPMKLAVTAVNAPSRKWHGDQVPIELGGMTDGKGRVLPFGELPDYAQTRVIERYDELPEDVKRAVREDLQRWVPDVMLDRPTAAGIALALVYARTSRDAEVEELAERLYTATHPHGPVWKTLTKVIHGLHRDYARVALGLAVKTLRATEAALLFCPACARQHIDEGEWRAKPHHTHLCAFCAFEWRVEPYCVGVQFVPPRQPTGRMGWRD